MALKRISYVWNYPGGQGTITAAMGTKHQIRTCLHFIISTNLCAFTFTQLLSWKITNCGDMYFEYLDGDRADNCLLPRGCYDSVNEQFRECLRDIMAIYQISSDPFMSETKINKRWTIEA